MKFNTGLSQSIASLPTKKLIKDYLKDAAPLLNKYKL
jgi:hypothetical protein